MKAEDAFRKLPAAEQKVRRELWRAMTQFVTKMMELMEPGLEQKLAELEMGMNRGDELEMDDTLRRHLTENFRIEVERAAEHGVECSMPWFNLATWTERGKVRIGYFARALECIESGRDALPGMAEAQPTGRDARMRAECLYEIARVHAYEGDAAVARDFLMRAVTLAQEAEALRQEAGVEKANNLEDRIAELLVQLPDEGDDHLSEIK